MRTLILIALLLSANTSRADEPCVNCTADQAQQWQDRQRTKAEIAEAVTRYADALRALSADSKAPTLEDAADPAAMLHADMVAVRAAGTRLMTLDSSRVSIAGLNAIEASTESLLSRELACRDTALCVEPRQARHLCALIAERQSYVDALRAEKTGDVWNLRAIYNIEASLQFSDKRIAAARAEYRRMQGRAFAGKCQDTAITGTRPS